MRIVSIFRSRTRAELAWLRGILVRPRANLEILVAISVVVALSVVVRSLASSLPQPVDTWFDIAISCLDVLVALAGIATAMLTKKGFAGALVGAVSLGGLALGVLPIVPGRLVLDYPTELAEDADLLGSDRFWITPSDREGPSQSLDVSECPEKDRGRCRTVVRVPRGVHDIRLESAIWRAPEVRGVQVGLIRRRVRIEARAENGILRVEVPQGFHHGDISLFRDGGETFKLARGGAPTALPAGTYYIVDESRCLTGPSDGVVVARRDVRLLRLRVNCGRLTIPLPPGLLPASVDARADGQAVLHLGRPDARALVFELEAGTHHLSLTPAAGSCFGQAVRLVAVRPGAPVRLDPDLPRTCGTVKVQLPREPATPFQVYVDGEPLGSAPTTGGWLRVDRVEAGRRRIRVEPTDPCFEGTEETLSVQTGAEATMAPPQYICATLEVPLSGPCLSAIDVEVTVDGAQVETTRPDPTSLRIARIPTGRRIDVELAVADLDGARSRYGVALRPGEERLLPDFSVSADQWQRTVPGVVHVVDGARSRRGNMKLDGVRITFAPYGGSREARHDVGLVWSEIVVREADTLTAAAETGSELVVEESGGRGGYGRLHRFMFRGGTPLSAQFDRCMILDELSSPRCRSGRVESCEIAWPDRLMENAVGSWISIQSG